ncbi:hypothetical protein F384_27335 (plasmid) [Citrobacter amalonaticus Y19]|uniref:Cation efflux protein transmembrane domain-containing protein n=1 Tax=Citrobacter amalonaticus Y19 TaxID=1261127 RepID=A0A0F6U088_CITAM|nr:cation diffusion facilitator family transporter [Citrobacter amalonaticus]AKE62256.1 hypothetical protein F384_27335 [Citrobacter amalonaticus Y19]EHX1549055.1 cation transporter [Escherichia coli]
MSEHHEHHRHHAVSSGVRLYWALGLTLSFSIVELVFGWMSGSLALLADAGHMVTDGAALGLAAFSAWLANKKPSEKHSFGWGRAELFAALFNAITMLLVVAGIAFESWQRFMNTQPINGLSVSIVAVIGLIINIIVAKILSAGQDNLNVKAAFIHVLGDLLGSVAALIAGIVIWTTGWTPIDPLLSLVIGGIVLSSSLSLLKNSFHRLLDGVPAPYSLMELAEKLKSINGVVCIADLHLWSISAERSALTATVYLQSFDLWPEILHQLQHEMNDEGINHCTFQPELISDKSLDCQDILCTQLRY